jgi:anti-anti-sigma factor
VRHGPVCVLAVTGELDLFTVADLAESAAAALAAPAERFVLDLSGLRFIDCSGARALGAVTQAVPAGCPVIVRSVSPAVRRVMDLLASKPRISEGGPGIATWPSHGLLGQAVRAMLNVMPR